MSYDCSKCGGACCSFEEESKTPGLPYWVAVDPDEAAWFRKLYGKNFVKKFTYRSEAGVTTTIERLPIKLSSIFNAEVCHFLEGEPGIGGRCSIYEGRPNVCREYRNGGVECLEDRRFHSIPDDRGLLQIEV